MSQNGKGSKRRPKSISYKTWSENFDRIFNHGKKKQKNNKKPK